jgi:hypothetical protein
VPDLYLDGPNFVVLNGHLDCSQVNKQRLGYAMLSHWPVHFRDQNMFA